MRCKRRYFQSFVREQELLVTGVPQSRELALQHDGRNNGQLVEVVRALAEFRSAAVLFDAHHPARAPHGKPQRGETLDCSWWEAFFDIQHGLFRVMKERETVKRS